MIFTYRYIREVIWIWITWTYTLGRIKIIEFSGLVRGKKDNKMQLSTQQTQRGTKNSSFSLVPSYYSQGSKLTLVQQYHRCLCLVISRRTTGFPDICPGLSHFTRRLLQHYCVWKLARWYSQCHILWHCDLQAAAMEALRKHNYLHKNHCLINS